MWTRSSVHWPGPLSSTGASPLLTTDFSNDVRRTLLDDTRQNVVDGDFNDYVRHSTHLLATIPPAAANVNPRIVVNRIVCGLARRGLFNNTTTNDMRLELPLSQEVLFTSRADPTADEQRHVHRIWGSSKNSIGLPDIVSGIDAVSLNAMLLQLQLDVWEQDTTDRKDEWTKVTAQLLWEGAIHQSDRSLVPNVPAMASYAGFTLDGVVRYSDTDYSRDGRTDPAVVTVAVYGETTINNVWGNGRHLRPGSTLAFILAPCLLSDLLDNNASRVTEGSSGAVTYSLRLRRARAEYMGSTRSHVVTIPPSATGRTYTLSHLVEFTPFQLVPVVLPPGATLLEDDAMDIRQIMVKTGVAMVLPVGRILSTRRRRPDAMIIDRRIIPSDYRPLRDAAESTPADTLSVLIDIDNGLLQKNASMVASSSSSSLHKTLDMLMKIMRRISTDTAAISDSMVVDVERDGPLSLTVYDRLPADLKKKLDRTEEFREMKADIFTIILRRVDIRDDVYPGRTRDVHHHKHTTVKPLASDSYEKRRTPFSPGLPSSEYKRKFEPSSASAKPSSTHSSSLPEESEDTSTLLSIIDSVAESGKGGSQNSSPRRSPTRLNSDDISSVSNPRRASSLVTSISPNKLHPLARSRSQGHDATDNDSGPSDASSMHPSQTRSSPATLPASTHHAKQGRAQNSIENKEEEDDDDEGEMESQQDTETTETKVPNEDASPTSGSGHQSPSMDTTKSPLDDHSSVNHHMEQERAQEGVNDEEEEEDEGEVESRQVIETTETKTSKEDVSLTSESSRQSPSMDTTKSLLDSVPSNPTTGASQKRRRSSGTDKGDDATSKKRKLGSGSSSPSPSSPSPSHSSSNYGGAEKTTSDITEPDNAYSETPSNVSTNYADNAESDDTDATNA